ncbi:MAG TPA: hypothetical protein PLZ01_04385 [bacterium]|nr:hypothetical protein [bacterium]
MRQQRRAGEFGLDFHSALGYFAVLESWCICGTREDHGIRFGVSPWFPPFDDAPSSDRIAALIESDAIHRGQRRGVS